MRIGQKFQFESDINKIKKNYIDTQKNQTPGIINPLLLSSQYNPGLLDFDPNDIKSAVNQEFINRSKIDEELPKDFRLPVNRNDVISLSNWLDFMIETHSIENDTQNQAISLDIKNEALQLIYSACMTEIIRQVSIECNERAMLLSKIWMNLTKIWESALQQKNSYVDMMQHNHLDEIKRIHHMYELEIGIVKENLQISDNEKASLLSKNEIFVQNTVFLKNKNKKLEKDMKGTLEKFEELKREFKQREFFQKKMEEILLANQVDFDRDKVYEEVIKQHTDNLKGMGISFNKNDSDKITYKEAEIDKNFDLGTLVFGHKGVDTEGLIATMHNFTQITKDLNFMIDKECSTVGLSTVADKQIQVKIKKIKKNEEIDENELIEKTRKYDEKTQKNDLVLLDFIQDGYKEKPQVSLYSNKVVSQVNMTQSNECIEDLSKNGEKRNIPKLGSTHMR